MTSQGYLDTLYLADSGCLYIKNSSEPVWSSFDYPSNTLIKGQLLRPGTSISAAQLNQEYSTGGIFYMQVENASLTLRQDFNVIGSQSFIYGSYNASEDISYVSVDGGLSAYSTHLLFIIPTSNGVGVDWDYVRLESNGSLMLKTYDSGQQNEVVDLDGGNVNCSLPAECGAFGECSLNGTCICPEGFEQSNFTADFTCQLIQPLNATDCVNNQLVNVTGQTYLSISNVSTGGDINRTACEQLCMKNCTCTNALHVRRNESSLWGVCYLNSAVQTIRQTKTNGDDLQMLFLRIPGILATPTPSGPAISAGGGISSRKTAASAFAGGAGALVLVLLGLSAWFLVFTRRKYFDNADKGLYNSTKADMSPLQLPPQYTYKQLVESTNNFTQRLGYGTSSNVFSGNLLDSNTKVAVKDLEESGCREKEFLAAVAAMGSLSHAHLVPLVGFCNDGKHKMLVYELVNEGRSLNWFLFNTHDSGPLITATTRRDIALGTALGLQYLHEAPLVHGGVKPENIMIEKSKQPKLVDYGLTTLTGKFKKFLSPKSHSSRPYMAPEWLQGQVGEKADVYSLGVVILELVSGRRCLIPNASPEERRFLPSWGFSLLGRSNSDSDEVLELVDPRLDMKLLSENDQRILKGMTLLALGCVQKDPELRPSMERVVMMLRGDVLVQPPPVSSALDAYGKDLCAGLHSGEQPGLFMNSPPVSENSDPRPR